VQSYAEPVAFLSEKIDVPDLGEWEHYEVASAVVAEAIAAVRRVPARSAA